ncbi:MAG: TonB-dependent receptor [Gammaproteobacteria bacterium]
MKYETTFLRSSVAAAVLTLIQQCALADDARTPPASPDATGSATVEREMTQVVVTGTASVRGTRKLDTSFSITTANEEQLRSAAPRSTADVLKIVPGVYAETTGGQTGANIQVRGFPSGSDSPFVSVQLEGNPIYPVPVLNFFEGSSAFRLDDTIERVEVLRGGPSTIYSVGQPGILMNFILKKGDEEPEGTVRVTTGTGRLRRVDAFYSGRLAERLYASVGGFYRKTHGVRDPQFAADDGHQLTATLTRKLDDGEVTAYLRSTRDKNAFYTGVPLLSRDGGHSISAFPGFDPLKGTLMSEEMRHFTVEAAPGRTLQRDLADGRGMDAHLLGLDYEQKFAGWSVANKANYFNGDLDTMSMITGANPQSAASYLAQAIDAANADPSVLAAAGAPATAGSLRFVRGGGAVAADQQVVRAGLWSVEKRMKSFTDELRVSRELPGRNTLTAGLYYAHYSAMDEAYFGNTHLMTATPNARLIGAQLDNGVVAASSGGTDGPVFYSLDASFKGSNTALFVANEWTVNEQIKLDAGVRRERQRLSGVVSGNVVVDTDANPLTLYNNATAALSGEHTRLRRSDSVNSLTMGALYKVNKNVSAFARAHTGHTFISFDNLRTAGTQAALDDRNGQPTPKVKQFELGVKTVRAHYSAYVNAFYTDFKGISFQQITTSGILNSISGSTGRGVEFELGLRPVQQLQLDLSGIYQRSRYKDNAAIAGNDLQRQPRLQFRLAPSYRMAATEGVTLKLYGALTYVGARWSDQQSLSYLPRYHTVDAGVLASVGEHWEVRAAGTNLGNRLGLTEGNSRLTGAQASGPIHARPLFGRALEFSVAYRF